ncbi:ArdC family protein [Deinococcus ficus]|nr:ArdC family protein [Deinococcus ficus]
MSKFRTQIAAITEALAQDLASGRSERLIAVLRGTMRWRKYSLNNRLLIVMAAPQATLILPRTQWEELGRTIRPGAAGIEIYAPRTGRKRAEEEGTPAEDRTPLFFVPVKVYDIAETEGDALPTPGMTRGGDEALIEEVQHAAPFDVQWSPDVASATLSAGVLRIPSGTATAGGDVQQMLYGWAQHALAEGHPNAQTDPDVRRTEALLGAMMVCAVLNIDALEVTSDRLVAHWGGKPKKLGNAMKRAQESAEAILKVLRPDLVSSELPASPEAAQPGPSCSPSTVPPRHPTPLPLPPAAAFHTTPAGSHSWPRP